MAEHFDSSVNTRELALQMLIEINEKGAYSHLILRQVLDKYQYLDKKDRAFLTRLVEGTLERRIELDYIIDSFSKTKAGKMKPLIRNLLRMSAYQLKYMDNVPDSAVCNEAVKLAKKHGFSQLSGFVNGVLRNMSRKMNTVIFPSKDRDPFAYMEIHYSMPRWIVEQMSREYGKEKTEIILEGFLGEYPLTVRTNLTKITPEALKSRLEEEGVTVETVEALPYALRLSGYDYLNSLSGFQEGLFYVQDLSSMMVAEAADPREGDYIIDVCAAPGGKSTHLAEKMKGTGMVEARDLTEWKVGLIEENIRRHALSNMKAVCQDATVFDPDSEGKADVLICDLPCSGLGVLGRKTDIRYKETLEKEEELVNLQKQILSTVYSYVKPGGKMVYSTCTIHKAENEEIAEWFGKEYPDFKLIRQQQFFPGNPGADGFYLAVFKKNKDH